MALSDCVRCWETPCRCGHDGYVVVGTKKPQKLKDLPEDRFNSIQERLKAYLDEMLDREPG